MKAASNSAMPDSHIAKTKFCAISISTNNGGAVISAGIYPRNYSNSSGGQYYAHTIVSHTATRRANPLKMGRIEWLKHSRRMNFLWCLFQFLTTPEILSSGTSIALEMQTKLSEMGSSGTSAIP